MSRGGAPGPGAETVRRRRHLGRGHRGETLAAWALRLKGYRIVARQYRTKLGEIDIIARRADLVAIVEVKATQETELGQVIYANAITLTPGTLTLHVEDDRMLIHALNQDLIDELRKGQMVPWAKTLDKP